MPPGKNHSQPSPVPTEQLNNSKPHTSYLTQFSILNSSHSAFIIPHSVFPADQKVKSLKQVIRNNLNINDILMYPFCDTKSRDKGAYESTGGFLFLLE